MSESDPDDFTSHLRPASPSGETVLAKERASSSLPVSDLSRHLFPSDFLARQARILPYLQREKLFSKSAQLNLSRPDRYKLGLARAKKLRRMKVHHSWSEEDVKMAEYLVDDFSPYFLQMSMFITTVREQGSEEQRNYWIPLVEAWKVYGAYAQTEMGHGSNVKGLELEARYDPATKEFVLHSPTLTASKWWNGSMGRTATHAIVVAQLLLPKNGHNVGATGTAGAPSNHAGQDPANTPSNTTPTSNTTTTEYTSHGPHPFIVQLRDMKTHLPLPGIVVGDIGPKVGYAPMDNGYLLFHEHRIPHSAFLSRYFSVDPSTGAYTSRAQNPAIVYGSLTNVRVNIVMHARLVLARAVTVACRYLTIRRQFRDRDTRDPAAPELAVLEYPTVQIRVLPLLATTYALHYTGLAMSATYTSVRRRIESTDDMSGLSDLHATSSGLKSLCTSLAADGIEVCRRALGGHGFHSGSGLIQLKNDYLSKPTVEGDNWMITQQTASWLIKKVSAVVDAATGRKPPPKIGEGDDFTPVLLQWCEDKRTGQLDGNGNGDGGGFDIIGAFDVVASDVDIVRAFERRAAHAAHAVYDARVRRGRSWNSLLVQLHGASNAFAQMLLVRNFYRAIFGAEASTPGAGSAQQAGKKNDEKVGGDGAGAEAEAKTPIPPTALPILLTLFRLFSLHTIQQHAIDFLTSASISQSDVDALPDVILRVMSELRRHVVPLVDAWAIPDYLLDSALGRQDGRVYEDLFDRAHRRNPLNRETFNPRYWEEEVVMGDKGSEKAILSKL